MFVIALQAAVVLVMIGVACAILWVRDRLKTPDPMPRIRATLMLQLRRFQLPSESTERSLNARQATLLEAKDELWVPEHGRPQLRAIHCYVRNAYGEYFYVLLRTSDVPFGKHITHASARAILKEKYIAPAGTAT